MSVVSGCEASAMSFSNNQEMQVELLLLDESTSGGKKKVGASTILAGGECRGKWQGSLSRRACCTKHTKIEIPIIAAQETANACGHLNYTCSLRYDALWTHNRSVIWLAIGRRLSLATSGSCGRMSHDFQESHIARNKSNVVRRTSHGAPAPGLQDAQRSLHPAAGRPQTDGLVG